MPEYRVRPATLDDADALVRHRTGMFTEMGFALDAPAHESAFRTWLAETMPADSTGAGWSKTVRARSSAEVASR